ncbi:ribonuclease G [Xylella taiwanensis]|uniref:Ribonuclease G n=1 Tax=Xylella taiwanensis TaxID=1444770 RepID=A0ABS8TVR2_9GAMM|nr:ribonuclease G [Xylella taiwanensis]MCD8455953.1 ribonuclease G [Xylella taiwanensis]MCD8458356.1 ribonuclease G [Xylella taiwanensis]MCD8460495.1 ribonuclease G [Xylella taiwanensis]MCD8463447.1 ribonuclease G [Xylella taiwanensis]MCD8464997.1 ribonuclease G [Xylella taiwanensis]
MSEEILVNVTSSETRVAVIENGLLQELHIERDGCRGVVGNIYKGRVQRVMPGMQAAFLDVGLERTAFLHVNDVIRAAPAAPSVIDTEETTLPPPSSVIPIVELLRDGQDVIVQVLKEPIGTKGARLTTHISIPSRYLVLLPHSKVVGVSVRIEDEAERARLKSVVTDLAVQYGCYGYIVRTNAEGQPADVLAEDLAYLSRVWSVVERRGRELPPCSLLYEDLSLSLRSVRDLIRKDVEKIKVDSKEAFGQLQGFVAKYMPVLAEKLELYVGDHPIFDLYGVEEEIRRALDRQIPLKSGGYLVIEQTEAMTTVDVNTGSFVGQCTLEETVFRTNLEAAQVLARQLRLRNLGGIIVIDFIDMEDLEHRRQVLRVLEKALLRDHAKTTVYDFSPLGLVEMTRKRTVESLQRQLSETCPECGGRGTIKTAETVTYEIFREITRAVSQFDAVRLLVIAAPKVVSRMTDEESAAVAELEGGLGKAICFQADPQYLQEQYDVVLL